MKGQGETMDEVLAEQAMMMRETKAALRLLEEMFTGQESQRLQQREVGRWFRSSIQHLSPRARN